MRKDGSLGFAQAHSPSYPEGAIVGGDLTYSKTEGAAFGSLGTHAFGATGFMACPAKNQGYQMFVAMSNVTALEDNVTACLGFDALTIDEADLSTGRWQYV